MLADRAARTTRAAWRNAATGADYTRALAPRLSAGRRQHGADSSRIVKPQLHHLGGAHYRARLVLRLLPFRFGHRIVDDAGADLNVKHSLLQYGGANRDCRIHIVLKADIADGARINTAARGLELVDDLHRTHFWRAADRARGKRRRENVEAREPLLQRAFDIRHDVHHVRIALDRHL